MASRYRQDMQRAWSRIAAIPTGTLQTRSGTVQYAERGAGLPILEAVHTIAQEADKSSVRRIMEDVEDRLRAGDRFSDCLDRHPRAFPEFYRGIVRSQHRGRRTLRGGRRGSAAGAREQ